MMNINISSSSSDNNIDNHNEHNHDLKIYNKKDFKTFNNPEESNTNTQSSIMPKSREKLRISDAALSQITPKSATSQSAHSKTMFKDNKTTMTPKMVNIIKSLEFKEKDMRVNVIMEQQKNIETSKDFEN